jgi:ADP-heptose:LPS heptosyltransferase
MNNVFVPGAVRRLGRRVVSPSLPRVKAGFKTFYMQCRPANIAGSLPKFLRFPKLGAFSAKDLLARLPKFPQVKFPALKFPTIHWPRVRWSALGALWDRINVVEALEHGAFYAGYAFGTVVGLRPSNRPAMLFATTASLPEAILLEPMLRSLAQRHSDRTFHLWGSEQMCELYSASPYIAKLRNIKRIDPARSPLSLRLRDHFSAALGLGMRRFDSVICDPRNDHFLMDCFTRGARTESLSILDRVGLGREERQRKGRLVRHLALDTDSPDLFGAINETAEHFNVRILRDVPAIYSADTAAQLAHSRSRNWRSEAASIGATSIVAIIPCADPGDVTIGLGMWAKLIRELWSKHMALPILFPEGPDVAAIEQLSSLVEETPHARLTANFGTLERAAMLARVDAVIGTAGASSQLALAQSVPTIVAGSAYRRRQFAWARHRACYLVADGTGRLSAGEMLSAYHQLVGGPMRIRVAV